MKMKMQPSQCQWQLQVLWQKKKRKRQRVVGYAPVFSNRQIDTAFASQIQSLMIADQTRGKSHRPRRVVQSRHEIETAISRALIRPNE
jgi:hypothetical protein